jgi:hypothetical protein
MMNSISVTRSCLAVLTLAMALFIPGLAHADPPIANAGSFIIANEGDTVTLDGSLSFDPDGDPITYLWTQIAGPAAVSLTGTDTAVATAVLPQVGVGGATLTFQLTVTNIFGESSSATVNVVDNNVNLAPVASIQAPSTVVEGASVTLDGSGSYDPNGDAISYSWTQTSGPGVSLDLSNPARPTFVAPTSSTAYSLGFQLIVSDGSLDSQPASATIAVSLVNQPPVANAGSNQTVVYGDQVTLNGSGRSDPDGDALTYNWTQVSGTPVTLNLADPVHPTFVAPSVTGELQFNLVVSDGQASSTPSTVAIFDYPPESVPNCANARANRQQLWPPNHAMARIKIRGMEVNMSTNDMNADSDDNADDANESADNVQIRVNGVTQDEPTLGTGIGDIGPDAVISSTRNDSSQRVQDMVLLRKERSESGDGRIYQINFTATNRISNISCTGSVTVCVPTKKGKNGECVNSGQNYNSTK